MYKSNQNFYYFHVTLWYKKGIDINCVKDYKALIITFFVFKKYHKIFVIITMFFLV